MVPIQAQRVGRAKERCYFTSRLIAAPALPKRRSARRDNRAPPRSPRMDPFTVIVLLAIHLAGSGGLMFFIWRLMPAAPGLGRWWIASSLFGLAYLVRLVTGLHATDPRGIAADGLMLLAVLLFSDGVHEFVGRALRRWQLTAALWGCLFAGDVIAALAVGAHARHAALNVTIASLYAAVTWTLAVNVARQPAPLHAPLRILAAMLGGLSALTLLRAHSFVQDDIAVAFDGLQAQIFYVYASLAAVVAALILLWMQFLRLNGQLADLATRDALTGVLNRHGLDDAVKRHFDRRHAPPLTVLLVDIDHFKQINDSFGHATGDAVLKAVAGTLTSQLRAEDFVARIGGEEFVVGCAGTQHEAALALAQRLNGSVDQLQVRSADGERGVECTVSVGVSARCASRDEWDRAAVQADQALYQAKQAGRNVVRHLAANLAV